MKKLLLLALPALMFMACRPAQECPGQHRHAHWIYQSSIYELNVRQATPEGTFAAAEALLPELRNAGIDIIWVMPCQPIGEQCRKGSLGSYYAIRDYKAINPEFGTMDDFKSFLDQAHRLHMKVILDWVANHTAPDHPWTKNEGWHVRDSLGNLLVQYDWTDIAKLNYDNQDMREEMKRCMHFWMDSVGIDGFRCDVAGEVPTDFWNDIMGELRAQYPDMFTLAENEDKASELCETAFDAYYGWTLHWLMNEIAKGNKTSEDLWNYLHDADTLTYKAIRMNFTSNHDENSWNGTEYERLGDARKMMAALCYILPGMPMIYTGQLSGNQHRLRFFDKDTIDQNEVRGEDYYFYRSLDSLRVANRALWANEIGGRVERLGCNNPNVFVCGRHRNCLRHIDDSYVIGIFNMSPEPQEATIDLTGWVGKYICGDCKHVKEFGPTKTIKLKPWGYKILTR